MWWKALKWDRIIFYRAQMLVAWKEVKRSWKLIWISVLLTSSHDSSSNLSEMKFKLITPSHLNSIARHQALILKCLLTVRYQIEKRTLNYNIFMFSFWTVIHLELFQGKTFCLHSPVVKIYRCYCNVCVRLQQPKKIFVLNEIQQNKDYYCKIFSSWVVKEMQTISFNNYQRFPFLFTF